MTKTNTPDIIAQENAIVVIITHICITKSPVTDQICTVLMLL